MKKPDFGSCNFNVRSLGHRKRSHLSCPSNIKHLIEFIEAEGHLGSNPGNKNKISVRGFNLCIQLNNNKYVTIFNYTKKGYLHLNLLHT